ncbi:putative bifunctional diguanylate cyclase/phosphodiesterase [Roseateles toxinivorans]|uniref:PAS domain S-box-containing protein/diguanylate cyclase (GGDEF)-like protein n=1 Tax=Roseateles toxinivorans TaxID=270368 RepID=A0A4V6PV50_9BURK|nr:bifunctional diguanylate cyclase/phosphodiesterase [Roseateles toxinivorans]TDP63954.1 PAS domain S-box-containing protein/diguanylate cyclase (GGDEF)-like protein [Roseateles toxinivorans]
MGRPADNTDPTTGSAQGGALWAWFKGTGFYRSHLHDYNLAASRFWLVLALTGAVAFGYNLVGLTRLPPGELWEVLGWAALAMLAAAFPIQIPRSKLSVSTSDAVLFLLLALHGAPAAALTAGVEAYLASSRSSKRLTSRVGSLAAATIGMTVGGTLFTLLAPPLQGLGFAQPAAHLAALAVGALAHFAISTWALTKVIYLKRQLSLSWDEWLSSVGWVGALTLVSAMLAGLLSLNAQSFGRAAVAVGMLVMGLSLALLRTHFRQQIVEHEAQEARVTAAELEAAHNQKRFHAAFTHASIGMAIVAADGKMLQVNQALCQLLGYSAGEIQQRSFRSLLHAGDASLLDRHVAGVSSRHEDMFSTELRCIGAHQRQTWVSLHCARFDDDATADACLIFQLHDITSRRHAEGELHHIAYHDSLTDLPNRNCFLERLQATVERSRTDQRCSFALMYLDLDRFKIVNDNLGHAAGDELLKEVARRLSVCVRPRDLVARLSGDEFAILLEETSNQQDVLALGHRVLAALELPVSIYGTEIRPQVSIGITFSDLGYRLPDEVLRDADLAMYKAKADGKGRIAMFDTSLHEQLGHKLQLEADLRHAIGEGQLSLAYQPLFDLDPYRLNGFEALARWVHPTRGPISPAVFIALAEETGCIQALTAWAIDEAARQLAVWRCEAPESAALVMHVNVSGKDLSHPQLVPHVAEVLRRHGLPAQLLTLEITESALMEQRELAMRSLAELGALGVKLGIDDFGTGYSSLAYLSTLPFDCLKIDRSFVIGMAKSQQNVEIVRTILSLGRSLNKQVVAEGIETHEQLQRLKDMGTPIGQGYLLSRPLNPTQVRDLLREPRLAPQ